MSVFDQLFLNLDNRVLAVFFGLLANFSSILNMCRIESLAQLLLHDLARSTVATQLVQLRRLLFL